ncbi:VOC family protein [Thalassotalea fusca]
MEKHHNINYIEMPSADLTATKAFFASVFNWAFVDYGPEYSSFTAQGIDGGFYLSNNTMKTETGSALIVLYSNNLEQTLASVEAAGGKIIKPIFSFPGGRRFHFSEPGSGEFAVWSEPLE